MGASEENIRALFKDAEEEQAQRGADSGLHIIIFDEIDAICKKRGARAGDSGVGDTVVNQLLSKIDGVDSLENVLVIGMTNRRDMLDTALLRPGRLEVQIEISLPDQEGRLQILNIHTSKMRKNKLMGGDVDLQELAELTKNFSGAEILGLVKSATSFGMNRLVNPSNPQKVDTSQMKVTRDDFRAALDEVIPAFGVAAAELKPCIVNGLVGYGDSHDHIMRTGKALLDQVRSSSRTPLVTALLHGPQGSGKTAVAASLALASDFPYIKLISPVSYLGMSEQGKCADLTRVFTDAYKSPLSVIVIDDLERLLDYVPIGPRFSNAVLQTMLVLLRRVPPEGHRLCVLANSSSYNIIEAMGLTDVFSSKIPVASLNADEAATVMAELEVFKGDSKALTTAKKSLPPHGIAIKRLFLVVEMARQGGDSGDVTAESFIQSMSTFL